MSRSLHNLRALDFLRALRGCYIAIAIAVAFVVLLAGCAGYQIGNRSLYPCEIHTVYVPVVQSNSFRPGLGERLTEAIVKEIELRTPYKAVGNSTADSVLAARLVSEGKRVLVPSLSGDAREIQANMTLEVSWTDRRGRELRQAQTVPLPAEITNVTSTGNLVPEMGQSVATAQQQAVSRVAQQIVGMMERPW